MRDIIIVEQGLAFIQSANAIITDNNTINQAKKPTEIQINDPQLNGYNVAAWGDNNDFPQLLLETCEHNTIIPSAIDWMCRTLYGNGLITYTEKIDPETGDKTIVPYEDEDYLAFADNNEMEDYFNQTMSDFYWFQNVFPEMITEKTSNKIARITAKQAAFCRWSRMDLDTRKIKTMYYSSRWPSLIYYDEVPVFDADYPLKEKKFIYRTKYPGSRTYYPLPLWLGGLKWVEISNLIPKIKKALMQNSITIKYHVKIPANYWATEYPNWKDLTDQQRVDKKIIKYTQLKDFLTNPENQGAVFVSEVGWNQQAQKEFPGWVIEQVGDAKDDGKFILDSANTNVEIFNSLNLDPTLSGMSPGGSLGTNNGGSNKREAFLIYTALLKMPTDFILKPLYFIKKRNGWNPKMKFGFEKIILTTLDANPTGVQKTAM